MRASLDTNFPRHTLRLSNGVRVEVEPIGLSRWSSVRQRVLNVEHQSFPEQIRDTEETLAGIAKSQSGVFLVCTSQWPSQFVGYACGDNLSRFISVPGVREDFNRYGVKGFYLASVAVVPSWRHLGIGVELQRLCISRAAALGFTAAFAHLRSGTADKVSSVARTIRTYADWYNTGEAFDYVKLY